jgi:hypothetical protein
MRYPFVMDLKNLLIRLPLTFFDEVVTAGSDRRHTKLNIILRLSALLAVPPRYQTPVAVRVQEMRLDQATTP